MEILKMRHHVMLDLANGRNRARCSCGWYFPEPIEGDPNEIEALPPRWARYDIEEVLEAAQTHRLENDEEPWVCSLADELGAFTEDWLREHIIPRGGEILIDHDHTENGEHSGPVEIHIRIPLEAELEEELEGLTHEEAQDIAARREEDGGELPIR